MQVARSLPRVREVLLWQICRIDPATFTKRVQYTVMVHGPLVLSVLLLPHVKPVDPVAAVADALHAY